MDSIKWREHRLKEGEQYVPVHRETDASLVVGLKGLIETKLNERYRQKEMSVIAAPVNVDLPINRDNTLCGAPPEVIKKIPGDANQTATVCGFDHAADFIVDGASADQTKYFVVDGKLKPNTAYSFAMAAPAALEDGFMCESEEIDFSQYKIVTKIEVK